MSATAAQRDEFMPAWAEWDMGYNEELANVFGIDRGSFSLNMGLTLIDGTPHITDYSVYGKLDTYVTEESELPLLAEEIRAEASALYELADIITGIAKQQPEGSEEEDLAGS